MESVGSWSFNHLADFAFWSFLLYRVRRSCAAPGMMMDTHAYRLIRMALPSCMPKAIHRGQRSPSHVSRSKFASMTLDRRLNVMANVGMHSHKDCSPLRAPALPSQRQHLQHANTSATVPARRWPVQVAPLRARRDPAADRESSFSQIGKRQRG